MECGRNKMKNSARSESIIKSYGVATCNVSERCLFPHLYCSLFHIQICATKVTTGIGYEKHVHTSHKKGEFFPMRERQRRVLTEVLHLPSTVNRGELKPHEWLTKENQ